MGPHRDPKQNACNSTGIPSKIPAGRGLGEGSLAKGMGFNSHSYRNASRTEPEESLANALNSLKMFSKCRQDEDSEVKQPASEIALQIARAKLATGFLFKFVLKALSTTARGKQPANGIASRIARAKLASGFL